MRKNVKLDSLEANIRSIRYRRILNSHVEFTTEFVVELAEGSIGVGSSPKGETLSIYENREWMQPQRIIETLIRDRILNIPVSQVKFDAYLQRKMRSFGRMNCYALSLAFFYANKQLRARLKQGDAIRTGSRFPHICLNMLNGGHCAYTNPVLSDFPEFLLVSRSRLPDDIIRDHNQLQRRIREKLAVCDKIIVNGNVVNKLGPADNRVWLGFLLNILDSLDLTSKYDLMIDASAGDLFAGGKYRFSLTDDSVRASSELCNYWIDLADQYKIKFLEDPFQEKDFESWTALSCTQKQCNVVGDNIYSSDPIKIREGAIKGYTNGVSIKPDQAGTVSATIDAIRTAKRENQIVMSSHRSISTESTFLSMVTSRYNIDYVKIGPLNTDYSAVLRLNELIRFSGNEYE